MRVDSPHDAGHRSVGSVLGAVALLLATTLVGVGLGVGAAYARSDTYAAQATVLVTPLQGNPFNPVGNGDDLNNLASEAQLVNSDAVAKKVAADESGSSSSEMLNGLTVTVPPNTQILTIDYRAGSRDVAVSRAQDFARGYLTLRAERANQSIVAQAREIQGEIDSLTKRLNKLAKSKTNVTAPEQRAVLQQQIDGVTAQVVQLSTTLSAVQTVDRNPGEVITPSHEVGRSPEQKQALYGALGLFLGLAAGIAILVFRARKRFFSQPGGAAGFTSEPDEVDGWTEDQATYPGDLVGRGHPG